MRCAERLLAVAGLIALSGTPLGAQDSTATHAAHMAWGRTSVILADVLELKARAGTGALRADLFGWIGNATDRIWAKADLTTGEDPELQLLRGWAVAPYWDLQVGGWFEPNTNALRLSRGGLAVGFQGLAPGAFDIETALLLDAGGDIGLRLTASHDLYLTQRMIVQPRIESSWDRSPDPGAGAPVLEAELALRLRFEVRREFAPYVGVSWRRRDPQGGVVDSGYPRVLAGFRLWR
jgi:copper resistance protein B